MAQRRIFTFLTTTILLLLIGALAGALIAVLGLALDSALTSLGNSDSRTLASFLIELFLLLIGVLAVSGVAAPDGLWTGLICGAGISLAYGILLWGAPALLTKRAVVILIFAVVGALAAVLSVRGVLADYRVAAGVVGALFGLFASLSVGRPGNAARDGGISG
jgi:hypothetical protein